MTTEIPPWERDDRVGVLEVIDGHPIWRTSTGSVTSHCRHTGDHFVVWMDNAAGSRVHRKWCRECDSPFGSIVPSRSVAGAVPAPKTTQQLKDRSGKIFARMSEFLTQRQTQEADARRSFYESHLRSPKWALIRRGVMERSRGICEGCGFAQATQVHHLTYDRLGDEMLFDLVAICSPCHRKVHGH